MDEIEVLINAAIARVNHAQLHCLAMTELLYPHLVTDKEKQAMQQHALTAYNDIQQAQARIALVCSKIGDFVRGEK